MTDKRTAIVLGGSGSVGAALLRELGRDDGFAGVITLSRRSLPEAVATARAAGRTPGRAREAGKGLTERPTIRQKLPRLA